MLVSGLSLVANEVAVEVEENQNQLNHSTAAIVWESLVHATVQVIVHSPSQGVASALLRITASFAILVRARTLEGLDTSV